MNNLEFMKGPLSRIIADIYKTKKVKITNVIEHGTSINHIAYKVDQGIDKGSPIAIVPDRVSMYSDLLLDYRSIISQGNGFEYCATLSMTEDVVNNRSFDSKFSRLAIIVDRSFVLDMREKYDNGIDITPILDKVMYPLIEKYIDNATSLAADVIKMINTDMHLSSILYKVYGIHKGIQFKDDDEIEAYGVPTKRLPNYRSLMGNIIDLMVLWYVNEVIVNGNAVQPIADTIKRAMYNINNFHSKDSIGFIGDMANVLMATGNETNVFNTLVYRIKNTLYADDYNFDYKKYSSLSFISDYFKQCEDEGAVPCSDSMYSEAVFNQDIMEEGNILDVDFDTYMECCIASTLNGARTLDLYGEGLFNKKPKSIREIKKAIVEIKRETYQCEREFEFMNDDRSKELAIDRTVDLLARIDDLEDGIMNDRYDNALASLRDSVEDVLDKGRSIDVKKRRSVLYIDYPDGYKG